MKLLQTQYGEIVNVDSIKRIYSNRSYEEDSVNIYIECIDQNIKVNTDIDEEIEYSSIFNSIKLFAGVYRYKLNGHQYNFSYPEANILNLIICEFIAYKFNVENILSVLTFETINKYCWDKFLEKMKESNSKIQPRSKKPKVN